MPRTRLCLPNLRPTNRNQTASAPIHSVRAKESMKTAREILLSHRYLAAGLVVALTLVVATGLVLTTTSLGCGPANKLGLKTSRCINAGPVAHAGLPTPSPSPSQSVNSPSPSPSPVPSSPSAAPQPTSPPSSLPPGQYASSSSYPPMAWPGSGSQPGVILSCSLPVYAGGPGSGGFIVFPGQTFIADPRSAVIAPLPSPAAAVWIGRQSPRLVGPGLRCGVLEVGACARGLALT